MTGNTLAVPGRWLLAAWISVIMVMATTAVVVESIERSRSDTVAGPRATAASSPPATVPPTTAGGPVAANQVRLTGEVTAVHVEGAVLHPRSFRTPLTVEAERGFGNGATVTGAVVDDEPATIVWDAGRPLVLQGGGGLVLDPVTVGLSPNGLVVALGDVVCGFAPGSYTIATPVAVGTSGVAEARDAVTFDADENTSIAFQGNTALILGDGTRLVATGPGRVVLDGTFQVTTAQGTVSASHVGLERGPYRVVLVREAGTVSVEAQLQGRLHIS